jgi:hypothetical protein
MPIKLPQHDTSVYEHDILLANSGSRMKGKSKVLLKKEIFIEKSNKAAYKN